VPASNTTQVIQAPKVATIVQRGPIKRSKSDRREATFPMFVAEQRQRLWDAVRGELIRGVPQSRTTGRIVHRGAEAPR
jgi:hypothetical protein